MEPIIDPESWDVIVAGSGLPECLYASAACKAGRSVLLLEQEDTYGSEYASMTLVALRQAATTGVVTSLTVSDSSTGAQRELEACASAELGRGSHGALLACESEQLRHVALPPFAASLEAVSGYCTTEANAEPSRGYIIDLMPKMLYQAEPLVDLLVRVRAHHYLQFKRVEGSYLVVPSTVENNATSSNQDAAAAAAAPRLALVPASKSDIFKDRSLSLSEKRLLMGFLKDCMAGVAGSGQLKEVLRSDTPLVDVLRDAGVPPHLRAVVAHGIAMADEAQEAAGDSAQAAAVASAHLAGNGAAASTPHLSARDGAAALCLLAESLERYGGPGAFMLPSWGCGSVPEAFVRCVAVNGGTTVLRMRAAGALLRTHAAAASGGDSSDDGRGGNSSDDGGGGDSSDDGGGGRGSSTSCSSSGTHAVEGVVTSNGQVLRCKQLVVGTRLARVLAEAMPSAGTAKASVATSLSADPGASHSCRHSSSDDHNAAAVCLHRALVIMDAPLVADTSAVTLVFPPASPLLRGRHPHAVRGLQMGPSLGVCPPGRCLLYLSTPACRGQGQAPCSAQHALEAAVAALVQTQELRPMGSDCVSKDAGAGDHTSSDGVSKGAGAGDHTAPGNTEDACCAHAPPPHATDAHDAARPRALQLFYYTQRAQQPPPPGALPSGAVCPSAAEFGLVGHVAGVAAAAAAFALGVPGMPWLSELEVEDREPGEECEALDSLEEALSNLAAAERAGAANAVERDTSAVAERAGAANAVEKDTSAVAERTGVGAETCAAAEMAVVEAGAAGAGGKL